MCILLENQVYSLLCVPLSFKSGFKNNLSAVYISCGFLLFWAIFGYEMFDDSPAGKI